jgi:hypothetical protein
MNSHVHSLIWRTRRHFLKRKGHVQILKKKNTIQALPKRKKFAYENTYIHTYTHTYIHSGCTPPSQSRPSNPPRPNPRIPGTISPARNFAPTRRRPEKSHHRRTRRDRQTAVWTLAVGGATRFRARADVCAL